MKRGESIYAVDRTAAGSMTEQLVENVKGAILGGVLREGDKLPPLRELAKLSGACEMVVREATRRLCEAGYVVTRPRIGCIVRKHGHPVWRGNVVIVSSEMNDNFFVATVSGILRERLLRKGYLVSHVFVRAANGRHYDFSQLDTIFQHTTTLVVALTCSREIITHVVEAGKKLLSVGGEYDENLGDDPHFSVDMDAALPKFAARCLRAKLKRAMVVAITSGGKGAMLALKTVGIDAERWNFKMLECVFAPEAVESAAIAAAKQRLAKGKDWLPEVIYCQDDFIARGLITAFGYHGIRIPEDVRLVTWSNRGNGPWYVKSLARIELDPVEVGEKVAERALKYMAGRKVKSEVIAETRFIDGETFGR